MLENIEKIRSDFPILGRQIYGKKLVYFDNAATSQKPKAVIEAIADYYRTSNANVHRGVHKLSEEATEGYEAARKRVANFVNAGDARQIIFTRNATEAINLVAYAWGRKNIKKGEEIMEDIRNLKSDVRILIDGAQAVPHLPVSIQTLGCDFYVFTGHKMLGPTGIGVLWARKDLLEEMPPFLGGGDMILEVGFEKSTYNYIPWKFEAGTPHIAGAIGLAADCHSLAKVGMKKVREHEQELTAYAQKAISEIKNLVIYGPKNFEKKL